MLNKTMIKNMNIDINQLLNDNGAQPLVDPNSPQATLVLGVGGSSEKPLELITKDETLSQRPDLNIGRIDGDRDGQANLPVGSCYPLDDVPAHDLAKELEHNPKAYIGHELLGDSETLKDDLPFGTDNLNGASEGKRRIGLFQFASHWWRNSPLVIAFLLSLVQTLLKVDMGTAQSGKQQVLLVVSLIASACGGTGSALVLLLRDILKQLFRNQLGISRLEFQLHLVLPGVFLGRAADMQMLMAKTYAFFIELMARYEQHFPAVRLGSLKFERDQAPFAWIYLYDAVNKRDRLLNGRAEISEVIKQVWQTISFGPVAARYRGLLEKMRTGFPAIFSAAGIAGVEYPLARIKRQGVYRTSQAVLQAILEPKPDVEQQARQFFEDFLRQHPAFNQPSPLRTDVNGKPLDLSYRQFATSLKQVPRQQLLPAIEQMTSQILADVQPRLEAACDQEIEHLAIQLEAAVQKALNRPHGLQFAHHFLTFLDRHQAERQIDLSRQMKQTKDVLDGPQTSRPGRIAKLRLKAHDSHIQAGYQALGRQLAQERQSQQYRALNSRRDQIRDYRQSVVSMSRSLTELSQRLQAAETAYIQQQEAQQSVVFQSLLTDEEISQIVADRLAEVTSSALEGISFSLKGRIGMSLKYPEVNDDYPGSLPVLSAEGITRHLSYCQQFWDHLDTECSVEGYLRTENRDLEELIADLELRATPWVAVNRAKQMPAEKRLLLLGTETGTEFVAQAPNDINVVATGDKTRLVLLYTIHGLDVKNLEQAPAWQDAYEQAIANGERLHVVPEVDPLNTANRKKRRGRSSKNERKNTGK